MYTCMHNTHTYVYMHVHMLIQLTLRISLLLFLSAQPKRSKYSQAWQIQQPKEILKAILHLFCCLE